MIYTIFVAATATPGQGRPKATPATKKCITEILQGKAKIRKLEGKV